MHTASKLNIHSFLNLLGGVGSVLVYIATTPILLKILGLDGFGVLSIIWIFLNITSVLDLGVGRAVSYELARNKKIQEYAGGIIIISILFAFLQGTIIGILFSLLSHHFSTAFLSNFSSQEHSIMNLMGLIGLAIPFSIASTILMLVLEGQKRFISVNIYQVFATTLVQAGPIIMFYLNAVDDVVEVIASAIILRIGAFFILGLFVLWDPRTRRGLMPGTNALRSLIKFGAKVQLSSLSEPVLDNADKFILSSLIGPSAVAIYNIPFQIHSKLKLLPIALMRSIIPEIASLHTRDKQLALTEYGFILLVRISTPILLFFLVFYLIIMRYWLGDLEGEKVTQIGIVLILGVWFNFIAHVPFGSLQGQGRPGSIAIVQVIQIIPYLVLVLILVKLLGTQGAAIAWTIRAIVDSAILIRISGLRYSKLIQVIPHLIIFLLTWTLVFTQKNYELQAIGYWGLGILVVIYLAYSLTSLKNSFRRKSEL
tara:strand:- start:15498 stop:16946 length:1449 start_codon:yes stop_codon:yes gene_type:complete